MADQSDDDWSDSGRPKIPQKNRKQGPDSLTRMMYPISNLASLRKGGKVRKSKVRGGAVPIIAHENERVIPASKRKKVERLMKRDGMSLTNKKRGKSKRSSSR